MKQQQQQQQQQHNEEFQYFDTFYSGFCTLWLRNLTEPQ